MLMYIMQGLSLDFILCVGAIATDNLYTEYVWPAVTNISCTGSEENLLECNLDTRPNSLCHQSEDASIVCQCNKYS